MKAFVSILLCLCIMLSLCACDRKEDDSALSTDSLTEATTSTEISPSADSTESTELSDNLPSGTETNPGESTINPTKPSTEPTLPSTESTSPPTEPTTPVPYLQEIPAGQPIYRGPGYSYDNVGSVSELGTYTIVEESRDIDGNLWGKLKSGAGWVDLTNVRNPIVPDPSSGLPYEVYIRRADQSIFGGPSYDSYYVGTIQIAGTYTIVAQQWDYEGNLWGQLNSGGWIDLTDATSAAAATTPISANFADELLLSSGYYHECIIDNSEYMVKVAFRAYEVLKDVRFYSTTWSGGTLETDVLLYALPELTPEKPFVAGVQFGDLTTYCITFTDSNGILRQYAVTTSGRNGALILYESTY